MPDPDVKVGTWIADVTYERDLTTANNRFTLVDQPKRPVSGGQRCIWYQVSKVNPPFDATGTLVFASDTGSYRSMFVNVSTPLQAFTPITASGIPVHVNAALIAPNVVQVIPRSFTVN
jgi:hypothetical protein